jgi:transcriptional regulator with XRE-family HTH domain
MGRARQTFERRQLGLTLRRLREESGKTQQAAADALGKARSRIVQLEDGEGTPTSADLDKLLGLYGVADRATVVALATEARKRQKRRAHVDLLPDSFQRLADLEASASEIHSFESAIVPGLLQCPDYIRAVMAEGNGIWWPANAPDPEERLAFRLDRQVRVFAEVEEKDLRFVLSGQALRDQVGDREVMRAQLTHLLNLPGVKVQVLMNGAGNPARGGGLTVLGFGGRGSPVGLSSITYGPSTYFDDEHDIVLLRNAFERVSELALSRQESANVIESLLEET